MLRWARALKHFVENVPVTIFPDELIVGRPNTWFGRWGIVYPELDGGVMPAGVEMFRKNKGKPGDVTVTDGDEQIINELLTPYWAGKDYSTNFVRSLPEDTRFMLYGPDPNNLIMMTLVVFASSPMRHSQNWTPDFSKILTRGVKGIREEAQAKLDALSAPRDIVYKKPFLDAVVMTCDAMTTWSRRYTAVARGLAAKEQTPARKQELLEIADVCERVPENPARTFREALQAQWWGQLFNRIEQTSCAMGQGRWDQYLWPFYQKDMAEGRITKESATELLHCVWLNMAQCVEVKMNPVTAAGAEGFAKFEDVCLGGQTPDGKDATNDLTHLILESTRALQLTLSRTVHPDPRQYARQPVASRRGNDQGRQGIPEAAERRDGRPLLSRQRRIAQGGTGLERLRLLRKPPDQPGNERHGQWRHQLGSAVEMTFRNGKLKVFNDLQFGVQTGDPRTWTSYDQVWKAFCAQVGHLAQHALIQQHVALKIKPQYFAAPATSMLHDLAMAECRDLHTHGDYMPGAIDHGSCEAIGKATAVDSLAAVKHLIFDTRKLTWDQLLTAIEANWKGHEAVRQLCLNAPKYGNGIEWVDVIGFEMETFLLEFLHQHPKPHDQAFLMRQIPITFHVPMGKVTWATPNGRRPVSILSEGISASHGMDVKGPTVALNSMATGRNLSYREKGGDLINLKFSPATVAGEDGTRRLMQIVRTWCDLKHWHVQFNILNRETLLAAQKDPEKYRNLIVRIAGYSAYFVDLSRDAAGGDHRLGRKSTCSERAHDVDVVKRCVSTSTRVAPADQF